ncbi:hypothetical protein BOTBODRAFT_62631 [Botryobasidium botryosum FD-172 SS1]|uniref:DUF1754-domain-containing protein n=1 Tax=Botryobasidium botryosum (strain FD-172 SS1) TaxID=930990 RepID=A0A067MX89_BOTB1|nr:hypothetical protein BOTBODRAFT_62631 [Botryobasidium botryosum FD-172 SS1]
MSDYDFRPGGSLKLKGGKDGSSKKKKSKSKSEKKRIEEQLKEKERVSEVRKDRDSGRDSPAASSSKAGHDDNKTDAERRFEEVQRQRRAERVARLAAQTHKDRVHEFNSKLEALSEHHDIPKVGPG